MNISVLSYRKYNHQKLWPYIQGKHIKPMEMIKNDLC